MRNVYFVLSTTAILGLGMAQTVTAADRRTKAPIYKAPMPAPVYDRPVKPLIYKPPASTPVYNWTGFYIGGNIGERGPIPR
jgi:hypothetical protein